MKNTILLTACMVMLKLSYAQVGFPITVDFTTAGAPFSQKKIRCSPGVEYQFKSEAAPVCSKTSYSWTFFGSNIRISDRTAQNPTVTFPAISRDMIYSVRLTVDATSSSVNEICRGAGERMKADYVFVPKASNSSATMEASDTVHVKSVSHDQYIRRSILSPFLFEGGWASNNNSKTSVISIAAEKKLFFISNTMLVDPNVLSFELYADGTRIVTNFFESGAVAIYAGRLDVKQVADGQNIKGYWKFLQEPDLAFSKIPWAAYPHLNKEALIANFGGLQEFVFEVNQTSGCANVFCHVFVDGNIVKDQEGNIATFLAGSSFTGSGKQVKVKVQGSCSNPTSTPVTGSLKLRE
jgi:hypothetical protein